MHGVCVHEGEHADEYEGVSGFASHVFVGDERDVVLAWTVAGV